MAEKTSLGVPVRDGESGWEDPGIPPDQPVGGDSSGSEAFTASQSEFAAPVEEHAAETRRGTKGGGQNKKLDPVIGIPDPKFRLFKSDATNPNQRFKPFCNYWNTLPQWAKDRSLLYVYREHPVLLYVERDPEGKQKDFEFNYIDKISGAEPLQDESDLLNRYGCGNYKLVFNAIETGKPNRTLCTVYAVNIGGGDFKSNPPTDRRISDVKNVDLSYPSNASYVAFLRGQGLLPNQIDAIRGEQEMASIEIVKEQQTTTNKLVDTVVKMAQDKNERKSEDTGLMERAFAGALETVQAGAKATIDMVREEARRSSTPPPPQQTPAVDPMDMALRLVTLIQQGKGESSSEVTALRAEIATLQANQMKMMQEQLNVLTKQLTTNTSPAATNPFSSMQEGMKAIREMKEVVDEIGGGNKDEAGGLGEAAADAAGAPKWLVRFAPLLQQGMSLIDGFIRMRSGQQMPPGQYPPPGYPPNPQGYPPPQYNPYQQPYAQPQPPAPQAMVPPGPQLVPPARHPMATLDYTQFTPELTQLLYAITIPLQLHLGDDQCNGTTFADWFLNGFPQETYDQIVQFGVDGVVAALYSFPPTCQGIQSFPVQDVQAFVAEFLNPNFEDDHTPETPDPDKTPEPEKQPA